MTIETQARPAQDALLGKLRAALGDGAVTTDAGALAALASDVYGTGGLPLAALRPETVVDLQEAVRICAAEKLAMVPRGGGASYTDGYLVPRGGHVIVDTGALDEIAIDLENAIVTVGAGTTWAALKAALDARGVRTPFWGPFSGLYATVGGSMSQNTLSHGSTAHGISAQSALGFEVVTASGELLVTNAADTVRFYGPDLTGLFTGDCGALGIKARVRLPLLPALSAFKALSFAFDDFAAYHKGMRLAQLARLDDSHFGIDLALSQGQIARQEGLNARLQIAGQVWRRSPSKVKAVRTLLRMAVAGENPMRAGAFMGHFIVEGFDAQDAAHRARHLRQLLGGIGREIANTVPSFVRSVPFAPLFNILGPGGERWVPLHGVLAHDQAVAFDGAFRALLARRKADMDRHGVWIGTMFSPVGPSGFLYEIALYWPDARTAYHDTVLPESHLSAIPTYPAAPDARAFVDVLKNEIIAEMQAFGAAHFQIGRAYPYRERLSPGAQALLRSIKAELDPDGLMNPGVLGL